MILTAVWGFGDILHVTNVVIFGPVLLNVCSWNPPFCWDQNNPVFFIKSIPILLKRFEQLKPDQNRDWILWSNPNSESFFFFNKTFSRFDPIRWPKPDQITSEQLASDYQIAEKRIRMRCIKARSTDRTPSSAMKLPAKPIDACFPSQTTAL